MYITDAWKQALIRKFGEGDSNGKHISGRAAMRAAQKGAGKRSMAPRNIASRKPVKRND